MYEKVLNRGLRMGEDDIVQRAATSEVSLNKIFIKKGSCPESFAFPSSSFDYY